MRTHPEIGARGLTVDELLAFHKAQFGDARMDARRTHPEIVDRMGEIHAEIERLDKYPVLSRSQSKMFDALREEFYEVNAERVQLERSIDLDKIRQAAKGSRSAGTFESRGVSFEAVGVSGGTRHDVARSDDRHPLAYTREALDSIADAIETRQGGVFRAQLEERAALATGTYGAPRAWGSNVLVAPRLLHVVAGVPTQPTDSIYAQFPTLTLPSATTSVGENTTLQEYASSTAGSVTQGRFGRWTDMSTESQLGTSVAALVRQHQIGISKDLDSALIGLVNTAAGAAVGFTADVPAAIRSAQARVVDATAAGDATELVILVHPDNAALLQDVAPIGGQTMAERFQSFSGSLVYPSSAVPTGFALVANLQAGCRYFTARELVTETDVAVKTGTVTLASSVIAGYGVGLAGGFASKVDVLTP